MAASAIMIIVMIMLMMMLLQMMMMMRPGILDIAYYYTTRMFSGAIYKQTHDFLTFPENITERHTRIHLFGKELIN